MKVILTQFVRNVLLEMCQHTNLEWSAWGETSTERNKKGQITSILVFDIHVVKQECGPCSTIMDDNEVLELYSEMESTSPGSSANLNCWIHSHADMDVFWSGTDDSTIDDLVDGYLLSIVVNKKGDILARIDSSVPIRATIDKLPVEVEQESDVVEFCKEAAEKITKRKLPKAKFLVNGKPVSDFSNYEFDFTNDLNHHDWMSRVREPRPARVNKGKGKGKGPKKTKKNNFWERDL